jgi:uncharacterized protein YndB with AHSA1/START domain
VAAASSTATAPDAHTLVIERIFDAPCDLVFAAWIDPKHLVCWLGPKGFMGNVIEMDARPGGAYRFHMRSLDGVECRQQQPSVGAPRRISDDDRMSTALIIQLNLKEQENGCRN